MENNTAIETAIEKIGTILGKILVFLMNLFIALISKSISLLTSLNDAHPKEMAVFELLLILIIVIGIFVIRKLRADLTAAGSDPGPNVIVTRQQDLLPGPAPAPAPAPGISSKLIIAVVVVILLVIFVAGL